MLTFCALNTRCLLQYYCIHLLNSLFLANLKLVNSGIDQIKAGVNQISEYVSGSGSTGKTPSSDDIVRPLNVGYCFVIL